MGLKESGLLFGEFNSPQGAQSLQNREVQGFMVTVSPGGEWRQNFVTKVAVGRGIYLLSCHDLGQTLFNG